MTKPHQSSIVDGNSFNPDVAGHRPLLRSFYAPTAKVVAPRLLGHWLVRRTEQGLSGGIIVETEAYLVNDPACHGYKRETPRNRAMYGPPGHAYVYFIYGNHWCFNAVCRPRGVAEAVLVRAIEPALGVEWMRRQRAVRRPADLTNGPAKFCAALDIDRAMDHADLCSLDSPVFIAENAERTKLLRKLGPVITTTRIGITQAADWPLRFYLEGSTFVSRRVRAARRALRMNAGGDAGSAVSPASDDPIAATSRKTSMR